MRTTVTIPDDVLKEIVKLSGKKQLSGAVVDSLKQYISLRKRIGLLELLFQMRIPHSRKALKAARRKRRWSA